MSENSQGHSAHCIQVNSLFGGIPKMSPRHTLHSQPHSSAMALASDSDPPVNRAVSSEEDPVILGYFLLAMDLLGSAKLQNIIIFSSL